MPSQTPSPSSDTGDEERAFLQSRVALFWQVIFFIVLFSVVIGAFGALGQPGMDSVLTLASAAQAGLFWWLCRRGSRSIRFSRAMDAGGLLINALIGALTARYLLVGFASQRAIATVEGMLLADGYLSMVQLGGMAMMVLIRAALVPSRPLRTAIVTALFGIPMIVVTSLLTPVAGGALALRTLDSSVSPWLPGGLTMMWTFAVITSTVVSSVIYGLRAEVRQARKLGQYVLEHKLGQGGMGEVYRARHGMMRRPSAIKLLRADRAGASNLHRFEREVQLTARLTHPNTITLYDYGRTPDGIFYYAMELLQGSTLERIVALDGAQPPERVVRILTMLCGALAEAHGIGLIHRDIKPANIMLCTQGGEHDVVKLLDFGLVKEFAVDGDVGLTSPSTIVGTPQYMAPESILRPQTVDPRVDIYALGAVAYYLLAGADVFQGKSVVEVCGQHLHQAPAALSTRGVTVSASLESAILACLHKEPERRPQSAAELRLLIEACNIAPWDGERARLWWLEHQAELESETAHASGDGRTLEVDRARGS